MNKISPLNLKGGPGGFFLKKGELKSGRSEKKGRRRKQAIAIGFSKARKRGAKVPRPPKK
jgi:hypothetical protein